ncbi:CynX/NimT family MFS transporter, partial [Thermodesulfobacteriota bacterium]
CVVCGLFICFTGVPLTLFCFKPRRPEYYGLLPDGITSKEDVSEKSEMIEAGIKYAAEVEEVEFTLRQALKAPTFWLLLVAQTGQNLAITSISMHGIPFLTDIGITPIRAAGMMAIMVAIGIPSRFFSGIIADRIRKNSMRFLLGGAYFMQTIGFAIFLLNQSEAMIYVWFILYGIGQGFCFTLNSILRARYFGRKAFGSIGGVARMIMTPIGMASPIYGGWVYDTTGSYISAFTFITGLLFFSSVMMSITPPPKPPAQITDIDKIA